MGLCPRLPPLPGAEEPAVWFCLPSQHPPSAGLGTVRPRNHETAHKEAGNPLLLSPSGTSLPNASSQNPGRQERPQQLLLSPGWVLSLCPPHPGRSGSGSPLPAERCKILPCIFIAGKQGNFVFCFGLFYSILLPPPPGAGQSGTVVYTSEFLIAKLDASAPGAACWDGWLREACMFISSHPHPPQYILCYPSLTLQSSFPLFKAQPSPFLAPSPVPPPPVSPPTTTRAGMGGPGPVAETSRALRRHQQDAQHPLSACKPYKSLPLTSPGRWLASRDGDAARTMSPGAVPGFPPAFGAGIYPSLMRITAHRRMDFGCPAF